MPSVSSLGFILFTATTPPLLPSSCPSFFLLFWLIKKKNKNKTNHVPLLLKLFKGSTLAFQSNPDSLALYGQVPAVLPKTMSHHLFSHKSPPWIPNCLELSVDHTFWSLRLCAHFFFCPEVLSSRLIAIVLQNSGWMSLLWGGLSPHLVMHPSPTLCSCGTLSFSKPCWDNNWMLLDGDVRWWPVQGILWFEISSPVAFAAMS